MATKKEREKYLQEVLIQERAISHKVQELFEVLQDPEIKETVDDILKDEKRLDSLATMLYGVLQAVSEEESKSYLSVRRFLDSLLPENYKEQRAYIREPLLGHVRLRDLESGTEYLAKCMDVSPGGVGIEHDKPIPLGHSYSIEIELYKHGAPMERIGKLVWMREVVTGVFIGGFQFERF